MTIMSEDLISLLVADLKDQGLPSDGVLAPEASVRDAAAVSIRKSLTQKWLGDNSEKADAAALAKFLASNSKCRDWTLPSDISEKTSMLLNHFKTVIWDFWNRAGYPIVDHPFDILDKSSVGAGSNIGARGESFYSKLFSSPLCGTSSWLYEWYRRYTDKFPMWKEAETLRSSHFGGPQIVAGSRLSFVPKNEQISRCICTEPTLNTYFQLGFGRQLESRLNERFGIALSNQQFKNRDLARLGSITDGLATLDLSSASDTISLKMLKVFLPPDFYRWLELLRCPVVEIPGHGTAEMHMVSSMGNGFTFPLETLIFSAVVVACMRWRGIPSDRSRSDCLWGVFGDDIICPDACARDVIFLLHLLGFQVNDDKSFVKGPFRESCGADFFRGADIRGVYLKDLSSMSQRFSAINQLTRFSTKTGIALPKLIGYLLTTVKWLPIPRYANIDSGIQVPIEYAPKPAKIPGSPNSRFYRGLEPVVVGIRFTDEGNVVVPRRCKTLIYNPSGLYLSLLQGGLKSNFLPVRNDSVRMRLKRRISPEWDWCEVPARDRQDYGLDWRRWNSVLDSLLKKDDSSLKT